MDSTEFFGYLFHADGHEHYPRNGATDKVAYIYDDYLQITDASPDLYTTDAWTAFAKKTIIDEATRHADQPFFLYLAYDTPHFKMQYPPAPYPAGSGSDRRHAVDRVSAPTAAPPPPSTAPPPSMPMCTRTTPLRVAHQQ